MDFLTGTHAGVANLSKEVRPITPPTVTRLMTRSSAAALKSHSIIDTDKYGEGSPSKLNRDATVNFYTNKIAQRAALQKALPEDKFGSILDAPVQKKDKQMDSLIRLRNKLTSNAPGKLVNGRRLADPVMPNCVS